MGEGANAAQAEFWGGEAGRRWVAQERALESLMGEAAARLLAIAAPRAGERVLEVGCGSGGLSLALARAVGEEGQVLALDVSGPLLERAAARRDVARLGQLAFRLDDAQTAALPRAAYDLVVSHFGSMFFAGPVAAFANLGAALRPGGRVHLAAWGPVAENPFMHLARAVAVRRLGPPPGPLPAPDAPGPFAFADVGRVAGLLGDAGLADVRGEVADVMLRATGGAEAAAGLATVIGPAASVLGAHDASDDDRAAVREDIREAFAPFEADGEVRIPGRVAFYAARRP